MEISALGHGFIVSEVGDVPCEVGMTNLRFVSNNHHNDEHSENSDPSGEIVFNAPLPPYERQWRHPSEVAEQVLLSTPEPRLPSRTVRSVVSCAAVTSFAVSLVLLWVVTPRSNTWSPTTAKRTTLATAQRQATRAPLALGTMSSEDDFVIPLTSTGYFVGSGIGLLPNEEIEARFADGSTVLLRVLEVDSSTGIAWLHSVDSSTHRFINLAQNLTPPSTALSEMRQGQRLFIASPSEGISDARIAISSAHSAQHNLWPIDFFMHDHCRGAALNSLQQLIGWCVELNGAHWVVPTRQLVDVLHRLESNVGQP
jgi:hypothetical protein